jgi:hypothetical protein
VIERAEEQFGMSPRARISLGISLVEGVSKLESCDGTENGRMPQPTTGSTLTASVLKWREW